jgi:ABC-type branched-subunit amino acid transport system ATPase component
VPEVSGQAAVAGSPPPPAARLEVRAVTKQFGGLRALNGVSFAVASGEIVALIGPNGAGKTTLFNLISGLDRPSAGSIRLDGREIAGMRAHRIARLGLGRTFQTPRPFLELSAVENIRLALQFAPPAPSGDSVRSGADAADQVLALLELGGAAHVAARHLPAGRRKLLELAMAVARRPRIVLLDEVLAGLTAGEIARATAVLRRLRNERGIGFLWVEHVMQAVMATAERVLVLHQGEIICEGPPAVVSRDLRVVAAYLGAAAEADEVLAS